MNVQVYQFLPVKSCSVVVPSVSKLKSLKLPWLTVKIYFVMTPFDLKGSDHCRERDVAVVDLNTGAATPSGTVCRVATVT